MPAEDNYWWVEKAPDWMVRAFREGALRRFVGEVHGRLLIEFPIPLSEAEHCFDYVEFGRTASKFLRRETARFFVDYNKHTLTYKGF